MSKREDVTIYKSQWSNK